MDGQFRIKRLGEDEPSRDLSKTHANSEPVITHNSDSVNINPPEGEGKLKLKNRQAESTSSGGISLKSHLNPEPQSSTKLKLRDKNQTGTARQTENFSDGSVCPKCQSSIEPEAVICIGCGFNLKSGKNLKTKVDRKNLNPPGRGRPAKAKKNSSSGLTVIIILAVVLGGSYLFLVKPALDKARDKAVSAKCKVRIKSVLTEIFAGGGTMDTRSFKCPEGNDYHYFDSPVGTYEEIRMIMCQRHGNVGYNNGAVRSSKNNSMSGSISQEKFFELHNINQPDPLESLDKDFNTARSKFKTSPMVEVKMDKQTPVPPKGDLNLVKYNTKIGAMDAYISPDPGDGKKHPAIIWIPGGFEPGIDSFAWEPASEENDQSAIQYRKSGVLTMYPSFRGGGAGNPGKVESFYGEVDDCLAAIDYLSKVPYIDKNRIYLGGHSTGGTMALLVAAAAKDKLRAVFAFGPVEDIRGYGQPNLVFNVYNNKEWIYRAPVLWLHCIDAPTFVMEGKIDGNYQSLLNLKEANKNSKITFYAINDNDHFSILAPLNKRIAKAILKDTGTKCNLKFPF